MNTGRPRRAAPTKTFQDPAFIQAAMAVTMLRGERRTVKDKNQLGKLEKTRLFPAKNPSTPLSATREASCTSGLLKSLEPAMPALVSNSVRVGPGQRQVTVTPFPFNSYDKASERLST